MQRKRFRLNLFNSIASICVIILASILFLSLKQPSLIIEQNKFKINSFISPRAYYLNNIDSVAFVENPIKVRQKLSGFDFAGIYRGSFTLNDSEQPYFLYLNENYSNKIFIYLKNKDIVIFNTSNTEDLKDLYKILEQESKNRQ